MSVPNTLRIEGELTIFRAMELKPVLLATPLPDEVDLSGVTDLDTAGVQLLMLLKKTALTQQRDIKLVAHSPAVIDVFELLKLAAHFGDHLVMNSQAKTASSGATQAGHSRS